MTYRVNARQDFSDFALTFKVYNSKLVFFDPVIKYAIKRVYI